MNEEQFIKLLEELISKNGSPDYRLELWYQGGKAGTIFADGCLESLEIDDSGYGYVQIYDGTISILVDDAAIFCV